MFRLVQDLTTCPTSRTVQAPQFEVSHPIWVPVRSRFSRMKWTRRSRASTWVENSWPLTRNVTLQVDTGSTLTPVLLGHAERHAEAPAASTRAPSRACSRPGHGRP